MLCSLTINSTQQSCRLSICEENSPNMIILLETSCLMAMHFNQPAISITLCLIYSISNTLCVPFGLKSKIFLLSLLKFLTTLYFIMTLGNIHLWLKSPKSACAKCQMNSLNCRIALEFVGRQGNACQMSNWTDNPKHRYRGFESMRDLMMTRLIETPPPPFPWSLNVLHMEWRHHCRNMCKCRGVQLYSSKKNWNSEK